MPTFGSRKSAPGTSGGGFEMFIKTFKDPLTQIAILDPAEPMNDETGWVKFDLHYDPNTGGPRGMGYPCAITAGGDGCVGCDFPVEHPEYADLDAHFGHEETFQKKIAARKKADKGWIVRDKSRKYVVPVIDPKGYVSLYQFGVGLVKDFQAQWEVLGSVMNNEWTIRKSGQGFDTEYALIAMPGEVRKPNAGASIPDEAYISGILGKKYTYALEQYGHSTGDDTGFAPDPTAAPDPAPVTAQADEAQTSTVSSATPSTGPAAPAGSEESKAGSGEALFVPREASTGEVKDWLDEHGVEYPPKAARGVLVGYAEKKMTELAGNPPF